MTIHETVNSINIISILYHYVKGKDSYIYCIDFHLDYLQLKFVRICVSIFSSILLVRIWNIFELVNSGCQYYKFVCAIEKESDWLK